MTTPRDGVPVIPGQTEVEMPERDASEVMSSEEEATLVDVIENATDTDFSEVTRPDGATREDLPVSVLRFDGTLTRHAAELLAQGGRIVPADAIVLERPTPGQIATLELRLTPDEISECVHGETTPGGQRIVFVEFSGSPWLEPAEALILAAHIALVAEAP